MRKVLSPQRKDDILKDFTEGTNAMPVIYHFWAYNILEKILDHITKEPETMAEKAERHKRFERGIYD